MTEKVKKSLYIPEWVAELLDREGENYDGPGVVAASSINAFCNMSKSAKAKILKQYREQEIEKAYSEIESIEDDINDFKSIQNALWLLLGPSAAKIQKIVENIPKNQIKDYANALSTPESDFRCLQDFNQLIKKTQQDSTISAQSKNVRLSFLGKLREELLKTRPSLQSAKPPKLA